jgi:carbamoyl-phosphate synthase large subunit
MITVLVSGASGIVGYGVLRSLRQAPTDLRLIGTAIADDSVAPAFCDVFERAIPTADEGYLSWLLSTIAKHQIDLVIPGIEADLYKWVNHVAEIEHSGAKILLNDPALISLCEDKWRFYENLKAFGTSYAIDSSLVPDFEFLESSFGLPFLLKPRRAYGARGIVRVDDRASFDRYRSDVGPVLMAQPIVGADDEEYTTSAFGDGQGSFFSSITLKRTLSSEGFTEKAQVVESQDVVRAVSALCRCFAPVGPTNFQFRRHHDGFKLLEINPRLSSSTSIRAAFGYNEAQMAIDYFLKNVKPAPPSIRRGRAVRYVEDLVFYDDRIDL